ncbi:hypothetical protein JX265_001336 [Neoarthrinium moseri]|uniref:Uncharacterized protein n=1 Tax=Neoarthrinium moseri TaxID=1658444 RepID=A0A9Q0AVS5_9PEZI|nr:hypothetical protein JX265_001336 [Neoarthrinium moseri]
MTATVGQRMLIWSFKAVNLFVPWHKLPKWIGVLNLLALRYELRDKNLHDTYPEWDEQGTASSPEMHETKFLSVRNSDGQFNDLERPKMGGRCMRFGRNVPREFTTAPTQEELLTPNPRIISEKLLAREEGVFKPATIVNLLAAAWIQFQVHDWAQHFRSSKNWDVPLPEGDKWSGDGMKISKTQADEPLSDQDRKHPAYKNENTHWWDGSQIYGSSEEKTRELRSKCHDGKITVDVRDGGATFLPRGKDKVPLTGFNENWWIGLELLHTLFALEHNSICSQLQLTHPTWTSDQLFDTARLINCALMAKIHTVEWTPAILQHPVLKISMNTNWWGLVGEKLWKILGRIADGEVISGIPGSGPEQDGAPYSLTEEFVSVYRLHPLIPDDIAFFKVQSGAHAITKPIKSVAFDEARSPFEKDDISFADAFYSFGINFPGAITHHNTPGFLRDLHLPDGRHLDMGTVDILRDRERGVPRYNQFRRLFHMPPAKNFLDLTGGDKKLAEQVSAVYDGKIELVDLLVGCLCEPLPKGFGFSDTAFRVFILMASRRLKSDRFIAGQWNTETYTQEGLAWVQNNTMVDVLCRHFPELRPALNGVDNAFAPWKKLGTSKLYGGKETNAEPFDTSEVINSSA